MTYQTTIFTFCWDTDDNEAMVIVLFYCQNQWQGIPGNKMQISVTIL